MLIVIGYKKEIKVFRRKKRIIFIPLYKDIGFGKAPDRVLVELNK